MNNHFGWKETEIISKFKSRVIFTEADSVIDKSALLAFKKKI